MSGTTEHREVEFKFRIPANVEIDVDSLLQRFHARIDRETARSMSATYFDTPSLSLLRWGVTLRHRSGGGDDGWHMKVPAEPSGDSTARDEIRVDKPPGFVPSELVSIAAPLVRRQELAPVAQVNTQRMPYVLHDDHGNALIEVVDDRVHVSAPGAASSSTFREVEVELLNDSPESIRLATVIGDGLRRNGAVSSSVSKAAQALGARAGDPPDVPLLDYPDINGPAVDALQAIFSRYVRDLLIADVAVRRELPDSVHQMRVACRRIRSALKTFRPLLDDHATGFLREELSWLAAELGQVRDAEVQLQALSARIEDADSRAFVIDQLDQRLRAARSSALAALRSDRHDFLLEDLVLLVAEPPVGARAFDPAGEALTTCARRPWRRLKDSVARAEAGGPVDFWHSVRINAKQARYAVEAVAPILGGGYRRLGKSLAWVTDTLGSRQDASVAIRTLEELARVAPAQIAFHLGVQAAHSEVAGSDDVQAFVRRWPTIAAQARGIGLH